MADAGIEDVFLLWHVHQLDDGEDDEKLIGVYRTRENALSAIQRVGSQPGLAETPQGFEICPYRLDQDHWAEGYFTTL